MALSLHLNIQRSPHTVSVRHIDSTVDEHIDMTTQTVYVRHMRHTTVKHLLFTLVVEHVLFHAVVLTERS